jgi:hypothetical protein
MALPAAVLFPRYSSNPFGFVHEEASQILVVLVAVDFRKQDRASAPDVVVAYLLVEDKAQASPPSLR